MKCLQPLISQVEKRFVVNKIKSIIFLFSIILPIITSANSCPKSETEGSNQILSDFYNSMNGDNWVNNTNWLIDPDPCTWNGISCNGAGEVRKVILDDNNLVGTLSASNSLCDLPALTDLNLSFNSIGGHYQNVFLMAYMMSI
jgi:hypothetical protein